MKCPEGSPPSGYRNSIIDFCDNEYRNTDTGPFFIFLEKKITIKYFIDKDGNEILIDEDTLLGDIDEIKSKTISKPIHPMVFGKFIYQNMNKFNHSILGISQINKFKIRIQFQTSTDANAFIKDPILENSEYTGYIPLFFTTRIGVVRNYPQELDANDFLENCFCTSPYKILKAERMNRLLNSKDNNNPQLLPTNSIKITFGSQILPSYICIHSVRCEVIPFIPKPPICKICWRFNHVSRNCRSKKPRCKACGALDNHELDRCPMKDKPICINCKKDHFCSELDKCEDYSRHKKIRELMVLKCYSYKEAQDTIKYKPFSDAFAYVPSKPFTYDMESFPSLKSNFNSNNSNKKRNIQPNENNEISERRHAKIKYKRTEKVPQTKPSPNFILPNEQINTCTSPLPANPYGPRQQDIRNDLMSKDRDVDMTSPNPVEKFQNNHIIINKFNSEEISTNTLPKR